MSKTLDEIRKKLQALSPKGSQGSYSDKTTYAHWNIAEGTSAVLRFLPDANEDNVFFWAERQVIKLPFPGILGHEEDKPIVIQVPCIEMWDGKNTCPILNEVRPWWRGGADLEATARKYWVKRTYFMQGFVRQDPMNETDPPENPIRKFIMGPQIFAIIKAALLDPDMDHSPVDYINGTDFTVSKTTSGTNASYTTSKWSRKESSITEEMQAAINKYGLVDLASYLPSRPNEEQLAIIFDMFQASLDGELYDPKKWAQHYKPYGFDAPAPAQKSSGSSDSDDDGDDEDFQQAPPVKKEAAAIPESKPEADASEEPAEGSKGSAQEILQMLRNRKAQ